MNTERPAKGANVWRGNAPPPLTPQRWQPHDPPPAAAADSRALKPAVPRKPLLFAVGAFVVLVLSFVAWDRPVGPVSTPTTIPPTTTTSTPTEPGR